MPEPVRSLLNRTVIVVADPGHACGEVGGRAVHAADRGPSVRPARTTGAAFGLLVISSDARALRVRKAGGPTAARRNGADYR